MGEPLRLTEVLTTSTAVATYLGHPAVAPFHVLSAIRILQGEASIEDLGRPQSPLLTRATGAASQVAPEVQALAQRWFTRFDEDITREFTETELTEFLKEVESLEGTETPL